MATLSANVVDDFDYRLLGRAEVEPVCGKHFCDDCGDCLHCYWDDECPDGPGHRFVLYMGDLLDGLPPPPTTPDKEET